MDKNYRPAEIEERGYDLWTRLNLFSGDGDAEPYCIILPPPNVTGTLHMGHAFQGTLMDCLCRYQRLMGKRVLWQPGTDHAGIATQIVVERQLANKQLTRDDLGRKAFIDKVWEWKRESGGTITRQFRRLGASLDWERECFTMDEHSSLAVREAFIRLYKDGLIYRGKRLINWDPVLKTAVSDLEVISEEEAGHLWELRYPVAGADDHVTVATTRPETMFGDTAVAVHPDDERYRHLIGRMLSLPLTGRTIPVVGDEHVDMTFGTGCVKVTPAHDFNDYEIGTRHDLPVINIFNDDATLNDAVPDAYRNLDRYEARKRVIADLDNAGLLANTTNYKHMVPRGERSGQVVEPRLSDQWFVRATPLAEQAIRAVEDGRIGFVPEHWSNTYFDWLRNIQDWCISRQIWWGHRIPAWYDEAGQIYVGHDEEAVRSEYRLGQTVKLHQDNDVLDTWFSSALWPFSTQGWPDKTPELRTFYPGCVLVTGFDIIFFWVARMVMMGMYFMDEVPFKTVYVHGLVRDGSGQKMSKSKGNTLDPLDLSDGITLDDLLEKRLRNVMQQSIGKRILRDTRKEFPHGIKPHGIDALRFTFASMASTGRDIRFDLGRLEGYRNFCNKLWNAARYVIGLCADAPLVSAGTSSGTGITPTKTRVPINDWITGHLNCLTENTHRYYKDYRFDKLAQSIYDFVWHDYCDWYLEFSKVVQNSDDDEQRVENRRHLITVLEAVLRLLHPIIPYITEDIWQQLKPFAGQLMLEMPESILQSAYPKVLESSPDSTGDEAGNDIAGNDIEWVRQLIAALRRTRTELQISPKTQVPVRVKYWRDNDKACYEKHRALIETLANIAEPEWLSDDAPVQKSALALHNEIRFLIPAEGLIDVRAEVQRLEKEIARATKQLNGIRNQMNRPDFTDKAPPEIIRQKHLLAEELQQKTEHLKRQLDSLS